MNPMHQMKDPAAGVPPQLLPHVHLVSKQRYPQANSPSLETIVGYLLEGPKIMHEVQPVQWQMLDCPADGTLLLTWQPQELGTNFASDGFVFQDHEQMFNSDVRGYNLQMYLHRSGFRPGEPVAAHSRRRYRLIPSQQNIGGPMPDPHLWLIHYSKAAQRDHVPAATIQIQPPIHAQLSQRRMIQSQGALARKEFMLRDRTNWPTINLPGGLGRQGPGGSIPAAAHRRGPSIGPPEPTLEEEEDVSRGDALDFMTPRDISRMRYEQHHEWMEEILESPYATVNIIPPELGLGRKGELEGFTKGFFAAPTSVQEVAAVEQTTVGKMDPEKAEDFTRIANERLAEMQAELEKMKQLHQKRMEKLKKTSFLTAAEKRLRTVPNDDGHQKSISNGPGLSSTESPDAIDEIVKDIETSMGKKVERVKNVTCIEKGGYQEMFTKPAANNDRSQNSMSPVKTNPPPTLQQQAIPQQQQPHHQQQQQSNTSQQPVSTPQIDSVTTADSAKHNDSMQQDPLDSQDQDQPQQSNQTANSDEDIDMAGSNNDPNPDGTAVDAGDWVMVGDQDLQNLGTTSGMDSGALSGQQEQAPVGTGMTPVENTTGLPAEGQNQQMQQQMSQAANHTPLDTGDFDMGNEFDDVNTAGDALADYNVDDLNLDMDDSAFGDAFHAHDDNEIS